MRSRLRPPREKQPRSKSQREHHTGRHAGPVAVKSSALYLGNRLQEFLSDVIPAVAHLPSYSPMKVHTLKSARDSAKQECLLHQTCSQLFSLL